MSWNDAFNDPQQDLFKDIDPMSSVVIIGGSGTDTITLDTSTIDPHWASYNSFGSVDIKPAETYIKVGEERIDERMLKRWRIFWEMMENDPKFADIIQDIETQIAFETLGKEND